MGIIAYKKSLVKGYGKFSQIYILISVYSPAGCFANQIAMFFLDKRNYLPYYLNMFVKGLIK